jgi:hypothetical protein
MSNLEIFRLDEQGSGWVSLEDATTSELIDLEWAIANKAKSTMLCFVCHVEIPRGNVCVNHKSVRGGIYFE